ncbi:MAG: hypothetical protein ACM3ZE_19765 [Myxococcales bacterium]
MATAWESAKGLIEKHAAANGVFVRLANNGDKVTGVFCGEPFAREVIWTGDKYEIYNADNPAHQSTGKRPSLKVAINFFVLPEGEMKIVEGSTQWFNDLLKVREKYGLENWSFEIERHGEAKDPKTKYSILPEDKIDGQLRARIASAELHDLTAMLLNVADAKKDDSPPETLIDSTAAAELVTRLKRLSRNDVESILGELGVERVRELKKADVDRALNIIARYESGVDDEVDPFA